MNKIIFAMIPARLGSQRLKKKNLAKVGTKALCEHAIISAKRSNIFDEIYLNTESLSLKKYADKYKIGFYHRSKELARNNTNSDLVVKDFFDKFKEADVLVWINTTTPFLNHQEIRNIVNSFLKKKANTLITTEIKYAHTNYRNKSLNYKKNMKFARTQDLKPIETFNYAMMIWERNSFLKSFKKYKSGILSGKVIFYPLAGLSTLMIKKKEDLILADFIMKSKNLNLKVKYIK